MRACYQATGTSCCTFNLHERLKPYKGPVKFRPPCWRPTQGPAQRLACSAHHATCIECQLLQPLTVAISNRRRQLQPERFFKEQSALAPTDV